MTRDEFHKALTALVVPLAGDKAKHETVDRRTQAVSRGGQLPKVCTKIDETPDLYRAPFGKTFNLVILNRWSVKK